MTEADDLKRLVEREDFDRIPAALARYARIIEAGKSEARAGEAQALLEWARRSLQAARARMSAESDRLRRASRYREPLPVPCHTFEVEC
jgi:hypothetical protein